MGLGTKILIALLCIAFLFSFAPRPCTPADATPSDCYGYGHTWNSLTTTFGGSSTGGNFYNNIYALLFAAGALALVATTVFPNPYLLFAGITMFLLALASIPYDIISASGIHDFNLSNPLVAFFGLMFSMLLVIAAVTWYKGNEW